MRVLIKPQLARCPHHTPAASHALPRSFFAPACNTAKKPFAITQAQPGPGGYSSPYDDLKLSDTPIPPPQPNYPPQQSGGLFSAPQQFQQAGRSPQQFQQAGRNPYQGQQVVNQGAQPGRGPSLYPLYEDDRRPAGGQQQGWEGGRPAAPAGPYRAPQQGVRPQGGPYYPRGPNGPRGPSMAPGRRMERLERGRERVEAGEADDRPRMVAGKKVLVNTAILNLGRDVRLLGSEGEFLGVVPAAEALAQAEEEEVDLVCISQDADPILCKLIAFSKYKYELEKKDKEAKKKQKDNIVELKEVRLRPSIDIGDLNVKLATARKFLEKANKVKIVMSMAGRELKNRQKGQEVLQKFVADLAPQGAVEGAVSLRGNTFTAVVAPTGKK